MKSNLFPGRSLAIACLALLIVQTSGRAQTTRPGSSARGTTRGATTSRGSIGSSSPNAGSTGPRQYRSNTLLGDATIQIDPETRSLVIVTDEDTHLELMKVIKTLDQPKPQVLIKVVFIECTYNKGLDIGVEGSYTFNLKNPIPATTGTSTTTKTTTGTTTGVPVTGSSGTTTTNGINQTVSSLTNTLGTAANIGRTLNGQSIFGLAQATDGTFLRIASDDWSATLRAMATRGKLEVLSRPSIMARNNQEAVIVVGSEVPFITNSRTDALGQITNTIQYDNIGIILRVTPFITSEGTVEMIVAPEISTLTDQTVPISSNASAPVIAKRSAETVVVTPNATTVVIGGLMETQRVESVQKVPLLGDIPYLGFAFRRKIKNDVKRELLIFLTPYIVNNLATLPQLTSSELKKTELVERAFSPQELERVLDTPSLFPEEMPDTKEIRKATMVKPAVAPASPSKRKKETPPPLKPSGASVAPPTSPAFRFSSAANVTY